MGEVTPEEKAVIEVALQGWDGQTLTGVDMTALGVAVRALIESRKPPRVSINGMCNFPSRGGAMLCILPNGHTPDQSVVLHEGRTAHGHVQRWKEIR